MTLHTMPVTRRQQVSTSPRDRRRQLVSLLVAALILLPILPLVAWSFAEQWTFPAIVPQAWGWPEQVWNAGTVAAFATSFVLATFVACAATMLGAMAGLGLRRAPRAVSTAASILLLAAAAAPPFALAMGATVGSLQLGVAGPPAVAMVLVVLALPYTTFVMRAAFAGYDESLEEQGRTLGMTSWMVLRWIRIPLLLPSVATAALLAFIVGWSDYIVTVLLGGGDLITLPLLIAGAASGTGNEQSLAFLGMLAIAPPLMMTTLAFGLARRYLR